MNCKSSKLRRGFTIVELLIVIVVIAILAAITIVAYNGVSHQAKQSAAQETSKQIYTKVSAYAIQNGTYPTLLSTVGFVDSDTVRYEWTYSNTANPHTFCATVTVSDVSYYVTNASSTPVEGRCSGHTGGEVIAITCPTGFIVVPGSATYGTSDFCVMKYEAKNVGGVATSRAAGSAWDAVSYANAVSLSAAACEGCHLITDAEWLTIAQNVMSVDSNWSGGSVGSGYIYRGRNVYGSGHYLAGSPDGDSDGYYGTGTTSGEQRRTLMLTNGEVIWDLAGNQHEWSSGTITGGQPGVGTGTAWREWNALTTLGTLPDINYPAYANPAAANWTSAQGLGQINSNTADVASRGMVRGGRMSPGGLTSGIFALSLTASSTGPAQYDYVGFRVAK